MSREGRPVHSRAPADSQTAEKRGHQAHPEIRRRGSYYGRELGDLVTAALMHARDDIDHPDPETAVRGAFNTVFATLVMRVAYGPAFVTPADDDEAFLANLSTMTRRYLFRL